MYADLGQPIAYGRTAEIYAWQEGQVLKLFYDWFELEGIAYEARIGEAVHASGLPVPAVGGMLRVNDRNGLVYQRVDGDSMLSCLSRKPWSVLRYAKRAAELHAQMHASTTHAHIPSQRQILTGKIRHAQALSSTLQSKVLTALETMPGGDHLCHGDFHPGNILITSQGEIIIDWIDASSGNPLADLARSTIIALGAVDCQIQGPLQRVFVRIFHTAYVRHYFRLRPGGKREYDRWLPIVAAARLSENIAELEGWLIARTEAGLRIGVGSAF
ncbi:MAG: phosphotransferase [Anaerolineales bacterium]|nr:phosphotransferase [Anaerolineales bacterium]